MAGKVNKVGKRLVKIIKGEKTNTKRGKGRSLRQIMKDTAPKKRKT